MFLVVLVCDVRIIQLAALQATMSQKKSQTALLVRIWRLTLPCSLVM